MIQFIQVIEDIIVVGRGFRCRNTVVIEKGRETEARGDLNMVLIGIYGGSAVKRN